MLSTGNNKLIEQFEALFNYATIGIVVTNQHGVIINFNRCAEQQFQYNAEDVLGQKVEVLLPNKLHVPHEQHRHTFYQHPSPRAMGHGRDLFAQRKDGTVFPVEVSLSNYMIDGETYVIAFVIDITVRKHQEQLVLAQKSELEHITQELQLLNVDLEQKVEDRTKMLKETLSALEKSKSELSEALKTEKELGELKSRFVTMASHEFKTPLSAILSSTYLLEQYNVGDQIEKRAKHLSRIKSAVEDMRSILDDFLSLGKLEEGMVVAQMSWTSANEWKSLLEKIIQEMEVNVKAGQKIVLQVAGENNIWMDKNLMKHVVINLLSNAIKFSPENAVILINCTHTSTTFSLSVMDEGIGISEEDQQHLFERFFRAKNATNIKGTGLGLHIVAKHMELMNGRIQMKSELNSGSVFSVTIPQPNNL